MSAEASRLAAGALGLLTFTEYLDRPSEHQGFAISEIEFEGSACTAAILNRSWRASF
jgi:hypothetical protein